MLNFSSAWTLGLRGLSNSHGTSKSMRMKQRDSLAMCTGHGSRRKDYSGNLRELEPSGKPMLYLWGRLCNGVDEIVDLSGYTRNCSCYYSERAMEGSCPCSTEYLQSSSIKDSNHDMNPMNAAAIKMHREDYHLQDL